MSFEVRTTLIHRCQRGERAWWRSPVIYEFLGMLDCQGVKAATDALPTIADLGVEAALIRPAWVDHERSLDCIKTFIERAHELDLKAIIRISGAPGAVTGTRTGQVFPFVGHEVDTETAHARGISFIRIGADGLDMGMLVEPQMLPDNPDVSSQKLTEELRALRTEIRAFENECTGTEQFDSDDFSVAHSGNDKIILSAATSTILPAMMRQRLDEQLLHHLRDDTLVRVPFNAEIIRERITEVVNERDSRGVLLAWHCSPAHIRTQIENPSGRVGWYSTDADIQAKQRRSQAMDLLMLSLPGTVHLHGGDEVALVDEVSPIDVDNPRESEAERIKIINEMASANIDNPEVPFRVHRRALRIRRERSLNCETLAFVDNAQWDPEEVLALMSRQVLVILNTSDHSIDISDAWRPLVSSHHIHRHMSKPGYSLPPGACAWFETATR